MSDNESYRKWLREQGKIERADCLHPHITIKRDKAIEHNTYTCDTCGETAEVDLLVMRDMGGRGLYTFFRRIFGNEPEERMHY